MRTRAGVAVLHPRLIAVSGPVEGRTFMLDRDRCIIGRQPDSDIHVLDIAVSRRHCEIHRDTGQGWILRDLDSRSGTFVNGRPVGERALEHGDMVQVGSTSLIFLVYELAGASARESADAGAATAPADSGLVAHSTIERPVHASPYLEPDRAQAANGDSARVAADLRALLRLCTAVHEAREVAAVAGTVLEHLLARLPADRGCVLVVDEGWDESWHEDQGQNPAAGHDLGSVRVAAMRAAGSRDSDEPFPWSRTVIGRALDRRVALVWTDVQATDELAGAESLEQAGSRSLLCAPLIGRQRPLGAIYLEAAGSHVFTDGHLELAVAAAAMTSLALENALYMEWLRSQNRRLGAQSAAAHSMVGESPAIKRLVALIERVAPTSSTVLIRGESGTGKELCARAIHASSPRAGGPFVALNCATLSDTLLESELFGHEKGAFTGAVARKPGKLELAGQGTLFLDEIGELSPLLQARLLRVLQEREFERVGGTRPIRVDVRIIAATNRDLEAAMRQGSFRDDLFYRLNVVTLHVPALRERRADIPLLARHLARLHAGHVGRPVVGIAAEARAALMAYDWPGNVRQLGNAIERALVLGTDEVIRVEDLPDEVLAARAPSQSAEADAGTFHDRILATKRALIVDAYEQANGDHQRAAALLGIHANSLHRLIRNLGLKPELGK